MVTLNDYFKKVVKGKIVVDLGCAGYLGKYSDRANILFEHSKEWYGGDINKNFIELYDNNKNLFFTNLNNPDFFTSVPDHTQVISLIDVIEHLENPYGLLKYIRENKDSSTELLISVPNSLSFGKILCGLLSKKKLVRQDRKHLHAFNESVLINMFKRLRFSEFKIIPYIKNKGVLSLMEHLPNFSSGFIVHAK
ncbi:hypothetical protein ACFLZK_01860 [Patescibacteria group bacterium]